MSLSAGAGGPTPQEVERLRLILSTYQDGTGMLPMPNGLSLPGWRDYERSIALAFDGEAVESKAIFDVLIPAEDFGQYGVSCKMRSTLRETQQNGRVTIELSNSSAKFNDAFQEIGIAPSEFRQRAKELGSTILLTVAGWHQEQADVVDLERSSYLVLSYNKRGDYQLHQFTLELPNVASVQWSFPDVRGKGGTLRPGKRLCGAVNAVVVVEYYYGSGGQLKYYPHVNEAIWKSEIFQLESLEAVQKLYDPETKAALYFPDKWQDTI